MPSNPPLLLIAYSARALAQSASRAGCACIALDLFNDLDTVNEATVSEAIPGDAGGFNAEQLVKAADRLAPSGRVRGVVYGAGFEANPEWLAAIIAGRFLYGNAPDVIRKVKSPGELFPMLEWYGIPYPETRLDLPTPLHGWLSKQPGGSGGGHVHRARQEDCFAPERYYQRFVEGRYISALFLANGRTVKLLGLNEQWVDAGEGDHFRYGGAVSQPQVAVSVISQIKDIVHTLTQACGLVGLNGIDFVVAQDQALLLEINPRPPATFELHDPAGRHNLFAAHLLSCQGMIKHEQLTAGESRAHAVCYAPHAIEIPHRWHWPAWCSDLPRSGQTIGYGQPICTVHAAGSRAAEARSQVTSRRLQIQAALEDAWVTV